MMPVGVARAHAAGAPLDEKQSDAFICAWSMLVSIIGCECDLKEECPLAIAEAQ